MDSIQLPPAIDDSQHENKLPEEPPQQQEYYIPAHQPEQQFIYYQQPPPVTKNDIFSNLDKTAYILIFVAFILGFFMGKTMQPVILRHG